MQFWRLSYNSRDACGSCFSKTFKCKSDKIRKTNNKKCIKMSESAFISIQTGNSKTFEVQMRTMKYSEGDTPVAYMICQ